MSGSNCSFLTCIQISQEAGQVVWYSHLLKNFPVCCDPHSQRLWCSQQAEVDVFLELSRFFDDPTDVGNLISGSSGSFWEAQKKQKIHVNVPDLGSKWMLMGIHRIKK